MFIRIEPSNGIAIYDQVVRQIKFAIANGQCRSGELIPSVRDLSRQLAINPNTVSRAYRQLQDDGVLNSVRGMGLQVATGAAKKCRQERLQLIKERVKQVAHEAIASGLSREEFEGMVSKEVDRVVNQAKTA